MIFEVIAVKASRDGYISFFANKRWSNGPDSERCLEGRGGDRKKGREKGRRALAQASAVELFQSATTFFIIPN